MNLKSFQTVRILCVDYRYESEKDRVLSLLESRGVTDVEFFLNGRGELFPRKDYKQITSTAPASWCDGIASYNHFRAFQTMIRQAKEAGDKSLLVLEDDVIFTDTFDEVVNSVNVPEDWDMLYYGANHTDYTTHDIGTNLLRCFGSTTTHCVAFKHTIFDAILSLPVDRTIDWNIGQRLHTHYNCYAIFPAVAIQKPGYSYLWHQQVDYSHLWKNKGK